MPDGGQLDRLERRALLREGLDDAGEGDLVVGEVSLPGALAVGRRVGQLTGDVLADPLHDPRCSRLPGLRVEEAVLQRGGPGIDHQYDAAGHPPTLPTTRSPGHSRAPLEPPSKARRIWPPCEVRASLTGP